MDASKVLEFDSELIVQDNGLHYHEKLSDLKNKKAFFIDRDGTLMNHHTVIEGAKEFINSLISENKIFYILTNNSSKTKSHHAEIFKKYGFQIDSEKVLVCTDSLIAYLKQNGIDNIYLIANEHVKEYFEISGFTLDEKIPQAVILTYDTEITYHKLKTACHLIDKKIPYFATHTDVVCPTDEGFIPDIGTYIQTIKACTGKTPSKTFGKPSLGIIEPVLKQHNLSLDEVVMIGDRLYTDIEMGHHNDLTTVLVLTGEAKREDLDQSIIKPDIVTENVKKLIQHIV